MIVWVIGASGLLGGSVAKAVISRRGWHLLNARSLPWSEPRLIAGAAASGFRALLDASERTGMPWAVVWAAGSVVTASSQEHIDTELGQLADALGAMGDELDANSPPGAVFYASSAGGIYAGSTNPPFTEESAVAPISPYGHFKLAAERTVMEFAAAHQVSSLVGRIANLYGPGQKLDKMQGLISHVAKAQYSVAPVTIYVPLDNRRDYFYASDCAELILDSLERICGESVENGPREVTKILASGQAVTVGTLLGHFRAIAKAAPHVMLGSSDAAAMQALDLRLRSTVWSDLDRRSLTPLPAGIRATINAILLEMQAPRRGADAVRH
jgi:UDP-glucose 4-epimerase